MKSLNTVLSLIACGVLSYSAQAAQFDDGQQIHQPKVGEEKVKAVRSNKVRQDSLYFIQLHEAPLATYRGDLTGYSATSIKSTSGTNSTKKGILNVHSAVSKQYLEYLDHSQNRFIAKANKVLDRGLNVRHQYKTILNAVVAELTEDEAKQLKVQGVARNVHKVGMHYMQTDSGPEFIQAKNVWEGVADHIPTKGEGVIVGIIDSGINASHPSFADIGGDGYDHENPLGSGNYMPGDCQEYPKFCNDKLIGMVSYPRITGGYEMPSDDAYENYVDLEDKLKVGYDFDGHGSHVASTAAGNVIKNVPMYLAVQDDIGSIVQKSEFEFEQISGVAPHANIVSYQVCDDGGCYPELTIEAIEHAITNGVNVLNYSVGGGSRSPWAYMDALAFLNAREAGIHVATSAGNAGPEAETLGAPGNSPWITTVAAYTHDRAFSEKHLTNFSGGDYIPEDIPGLAATSEFTGKVVHASDFGDAACLNPFLEGTFNGEIVICERGEIARVRKGLNVKEGGAGGLILVNVEGGDTSINSDNHLLPAIHLNAANGVLLTDWLATGSDHSLTITESTLVSDPALGDIAGVFTSRGPNVPYPNIFAPDVAGPGVDIYAANSEEHVWTDGAMETGYTTMSGTSMSSPHVAGALALIHAVHPDWTPSEVQSALMTTANHLTYKDDDSDGVKERSNFFDQGAGSIRIANAVNAGLLLNVTKEEYLAADPELDGNPNTLNTSSIASMGCITECSWTRTVRATADSSWSASFEYISEGVQLSLSPASFTLAAGEEQVVTVTAKVTDGLKDEWTHSFVTLTPGNEDLSVARLQVLVNFVAGKAPEKVEAQINNINSTVVIEDVVTNGATDFTTRGFGLTKVKKYYGSPLGAGPADGQKLPERFPETIFAKQIIVPPYTKRLIAEINESTAPDMDLYVGLDEDNNGLPNATEMYYSLVCVSGNSDSTEYCDIENPKAGTYWVFAHNFEGTQRDMPDDVTLEISMIKYTDDPSFKIDAPKEMSKDELFNVNVKVEGELHDFGYEDIEPGNKYYGLVEMSTKPTLYRNVGKTLLSLTSIENEALFSASVKEAMLGEDLTFTVEIPVESESSESFSLSVDIPHNFDVVSSSKDYMIEDGRIIWLEDQVKDESFVVEFVLSATQLHYSTDFNLEANYRLGSGDENSIRSSRFTVVKPIEALINGESNSQLSVTEGTANIELSALMSSPSFVDDALTYQWEQTAGPALDLSTMSGGQVSFATPVDVASNTTYTYQVTVSNGDLSAQAMVSINVNNMIEKTKPTDDSSGGGGGSTGLLFIMMAAIATVLRRKV